MPYYIKTGAIGCDGWATIKEDGEIIGCHTSKDAAIAQMVAVSLEEGIEPGGEMNSAPETETRIEEPQMTNDEKRGLDDTEDMYSWSPRQKKLYEELEDISELFGKFGKGIDSEGAHYVEVSPFAEENMICANCAFYEGPRACEIVEGDIAPEAVCKFWLIPNELLEVPVAIRSIERRAVDLSAPNYMRDAAQRGLRLYAEGLGGDGLTPGTIREARAMAAGDISEEKWRKIGPWIARHLDDLDAVEGDEITPGLVAHLLWGSGPSKSDAVRAQNYAESIVKQIEQDTERNWTVKEHEYRKALPEVEKRNFHQDFEVRELPNGGFQFAGYAAVFNSDSEPLPFIERILPGAFDKTLKSRNNVKMYLNHDSTLVLGATRSKTLRLSTDTVGLFAEADLPNTSYARDLAEVMMRGDVDSMSFGFSVPRYGDSWSEDGMRRELREIRLHEVSVVTGFPAYSATSASLRSVDALASAVGVDADQLAEALTILENGKELSAEHAGLLTEAVAKLRADRVAPSSLNIKKKHLELLKQQF